MKVGTKKVSDKVLSFIREYFADVPSALSARDAIEYTVYCRALDGECAAYKEIIKSSDEPKKTDKQSKDALAKELQAIAGL